MESHVLMAENSIGNFCGVITTLKQTEQLRSSLQGNNGCAWGKSSLIYKRSNFLDLCKEGMLKPKREKTNFTYLRVEIKHNLNS